MLLLPGTLLLVIFYIARPFELLEPLRGLPLLHLVCGAALLGYGVDIRTGLLPFRVSRLTKLTLLWLGWALFATAIVAPSALSHKLVELAILLVTVHLIGNGLRSLDGFERIAGTMLACALWICFICCHQSLQPLQCVDVDPDNPMSTYATGIGCADRSDCDGGDGFKVDCAHVGLFNISSIMARVRYIGILQDPNEVAMLVSASLPLAIAFYQRKQTRFTKLVLWVMVGLVIWTIQASQSRGGQVVLAVVLGTFAVQKWGWRKTLARSWPILVGIIIASSLQTHREDAEESTLKRLGCQLAGLEMLGRHLLTGVGLGQFTQYHDQTAHNAYVLAAAEGGLPGIFSWAMVPYYSIKTALATARSGEPGSPARIWGTAMATSVTGLLAGIFFLSFCYHPVLWLFFAMASSLGHVFPSAGQSVRLRVPEVIAVWAACGAVLLFIYFYASAKLG